MSESLTIYDLCNRAWATAEEKGLHDEFQNISMRHQAIIRLALVGTEVSEAIQVLKRRCPLPGSHEEKSMTKQDFDEWMEMLGDELADIAIRLGDLACSLFIDLQKAISKKLKYNETRPHKFGTPGEGNAVDADATHA